MLLQVGEWYRMRDCRVIGPIVGSNDPDYPFTCSHLTFTSEGVWNKGNVSDYDIVEHIPRTDPRHPESKTGQPQSDPVHVIVAIDDGGNEALYVGGNLVEHEGNTVYATDIAKATNGMTIEFTHFNCGSLDGDWPKTFESLMAMCGDKQEQPSEPPLKLWIDSAGTLSLSAKRLSMSDRELTAAELLSLKHLIILAPEVD